MTSSPRAFARPDLFGGASADAVPETVYVIDADEAARHSLSLLLRVNGLRTEAFATPEDFLRELRPAAVGCVIADSGATPSGVPLLAALRTRGIGLPVIVTTGSGNVSWAVAAMRAGASDLIEKPFEGDALLRSVFRALDVQRPERARPAVRARAGGRFERLTAREWQVAELVAAGVEVKAIGRRLGISPRTVETYRASAMAKLDVSDTAELMDVFPDSQFTRRATPSQ